MVIGGVLFLILCIFFLGVCFGDGVFDEGWFLVCLLGGLGERGMLFRIRLLGMLFLLFLLYFSLSFMVDLCFWLDC